ncbi:ATP-binding protein [Spirulina sp. CS-785/01]|uniref:ATP-binding protein n=1 Tax=Spirulina sp. CS-785/01 TaxID=3021716 RepID=UPI00232E1A14|nr:ATP-binding protein [Spirulina sp. CS-785/01]MDB9315299.1 ATP-binding protein [Spirulina sp. CS-785/01]
MYDHQQGDWEQLINLLQWLDQRLEIATEIAESIFETNSEQSNFSDRGIQIDPQEVTGLMSQNFAQPMFVQDKSQNIQSPLPSCLNHSSLSWLQQTFQLDNFDLGIIAIALAPELDRRYERIYAYLQDDLRGKRPTVDLSLNLLCDSAVEKLKRRAYLTPQASLIQNGLLHLIPDPNQVEPPLLAHIIKLDAAVVRLLLGESGLDERLNSFCQLNLPQRDRSILDSSFLLENLHFIKEIWQNKEPFTLFFQGVDRGRKEETANAIAQALNIPLLTANLAQLETLKLTEFREIIKLLLREAQFQGSLLYIDHLEILQTPETTALYPTLLSALKTYSSLIILAEIEPYPNTDIHGHNQLNWDFPIPSFEQRNCYWQHHLQKINIKINDAELESLSDRFRLTSNQIATAVRTAATQKRWQNSQDTTLSDTQHLPTESLFRAARSVSSRELQGLSQHIQPQYVWDDIVLPPYQKTQLREMCDRVKYHHLVWETWGFKVKKSLGRGLNVMFSGPSGTGKTMAAEIIAQELKLDLYKIDLSQMVSKYIGETEKNLSQIFIAATNANAILLFDEADALFGKRSKVKDARDRYANLEVSYVLQKIEEYEGLAILTTNLRGNMDEAFMRRLQFIIEFQLPDDKQRYQIWQKSFPENTPKHSDLNFQFLADNFELTGANIRNIALMSAFLAASEGSFVQRVHIMQAVRREQQKMGKISTKQVEHDYIALAE